MVRGTWKRQGETFLMNLPLSQKNGTPKVGREAVIIKKDGTIGFYLLTESIGSHTAGGVEYGLFNGIKSQRVRI